MNEDSKSRRSGGVRFTLTPRGPFSLEPVRRLQCGFLRGTRTCSAGEGAVTLAFPSERAFTPVAVRLRNGEGGGIIEAELFGSDEVEVVRPQVERMLAIDRDATAFFELLARDSVLARLHAQRPAFRPVVAASPYAMAGWLVLSQRTSMAQAAAVQSRLAELTGDLVSVEGENAVPFPRPQSVLKLEGVKGVSAEKWRRLQAVARAALEGRLELNHLLSLPYAAARDELRAIHGIGPWTADGILIRGCGPSDVLPLGEPTLHGAIQVAYGLPALPTDREVIARAEAWRPFRTWVSVFLISANFDEAKARSRTKRGQATFSTMAPVSRFSL